MENYKIKFTSQAEKQLNRVSKQYIPVIVGQIEALKYTPFPPGHKKLKGFRNIYRIRIGQYRVIYEVHTKEVIILILKIGHRKDVYR